MLKKILVSLFFILYSYNVYAEDLLQILSKAFKNINDEVPAIVNYCDFTCYWDYKSFKKWLVKYKLDYH